MVPLRALGRITPSLQHLFWGVLGLVRFASLYLYHWYTSYIGIWTMSICIFFFSCHIYVFFYTMVGSSLARSLFWFGTWSIPPWLLFSLPSVSTSPDTWSHEGACCSTPQNPPRWFVFQGCVTKRQYEKKRGPIIDRLPSVWKWKFRL